MGNQNPKTSIADVRGVHCWLRLGLLVFLAGLAGTGPGHAQAQLEKTLADQLRQGGYVLVMRHANSPAAPPDRSAADPENVKLERQLDEAGRSTAQAMGAAFRTVRIPIGDVLTSPTYRALQTVRFAAFGQPQIRPELDEGAQGMQAAADAARTAWLRRQAGMPPRPGTNTIIVTHTPNIAGAFEQNGANVASGESLVFRPDGKGGAILIARVKIGDWPGFEGL